ncbi:cytochrome c family protein [Candidatus Latescibacterota bacterium]
MKYFLKAAVFLTVLAVLIFYSPKKTTGQDEAEYVGDSGCLASCHNTQVESFKEDIHNNAYSNLVASKLFQDNKEKGTETRCYTCHATGYGKKGGFTDIETTPHLTKVGCEGCHGPGSKHVAVNAGDKQAKKATIIRTPNCGGCHLIHSHTEN